MIEFDANVSLPCWIKPSQLDPGYRIAFPLQHRLFNPAKEAMPIANQVVYISGPVTGLPDNNEDAFLEAERLLLSLGCKTFNPQHIRKPVDPLEGEDLWRYYMHYCVAALPLCSAVFMLPDWQNSSGAKWEHRIATMLGLDVFYAPVHESDDAEPAAPTPESAAVARAARARNP